MDRPSHFDVYVSLLFLFMSITHLGKGADCNIILVPTSAGRNTTQVFCTCPHGFVGNPYNECKPKIVACEKCGMYRFYQFHQQFTN